MKNSVTWNNWKSLFLSAISVAAQKCGSDVSGLEIGDVLLDQTWGQKCGIVFTGCPDEVLTRVCSYFQLWQSRHMGHLFSYGCQRVPHQGEPVRVFEVVTEHVCRAQSWHTKEELPQGVKVGDIFTKVSREWVRSQPNIDAITWCKASSDRTGLAVSFCYYPCAE